MLTCFDCNEKGRFFDLDEICELGMAAQWNAALGICPVCGSGCTEG